MNEVINHKNNSCIWYHTTPKDRYRTILREGLIPNSPPVWQSNPEPWIYLSTVPWNCGEDFIILEVNLDFATKGMVGWAFADDNPNPDEEWQLRCFIHIPPEKIRVMWQTEGKSMLNFPRHKCGLYLEHNRHKDSYMTVKTHLADVFDDYDWQSEEHKQRAIQTDEMWTIEWYPYTPISSYLVAAPTLEELLAYAAEIDYRLE